jgi:hypothetical protein
MSALEQLAAQAQDYQQLYSTGQLSASEFKELVENLKVVETIQNDVNDLRVYQDVSLVDETYLMLLETLKQKIDSEPIASGN